MYVLIAYDVNTESANGKTRLRKVAKICVNYGQRVQNSVFECDLPPSELCLIKDKLLKVIDIRTDSLRIYNLGDNYKNRIEHFGIHNTYFPDEAMIF